MNCSIVKTLGAVALALNAAVAFADDAKFAGQIQEAGLFAREGASAISLKSTRGDINSSWSTLQQNFDVQWPKIQIHNTFYPISALCFEGNNVRPINGVEQTVCMQVTDHELGTCGAWGTMKMIESRQWSQLACTLYDKGTDGGDCLKWETFSGRIAGTYSVPVREKAHHEGPEGALIGTKSYTIPNCK